MRQITLVAGTLVAGWSLWMSGCEEPTVSQLSTGPDAATTSAVERDRVTDNSPAALLGVHVGVWDYRVTDGEDEGDMLRFSLQTAEEDEALPLRRLRADGRIEHLGIASDGSVLIGAVEDPAEGVLTRYEPALTLIPAELPLDSPKVFEAEMVVTNLAPPYRERGRGEATRTVTYVGDEVVQTGAGDFEARRFEASFQGDMTLATVRIDATEWYSPEVGMVAEAVNERVRAALIFGSSTERTLVLEALPSGGISERDR
ncbi:MAG: hypothetical protein WD294_11710 [Phycisphaeraceae bacterium]